MPAAIGTCYRRAVKPRGISEADGALPVAEVKSDVVPALASAWRQQRGGEVQGCMLHPALGECPWLVPAVLPYLLVIILYQMGLLEVAQIYQP